MELELDAGDDTQAKLAVLEEIRALMDRIEGEGLKGAKAPPAGEGEGECSGEHGKGCDGKCGMKACKCRAEKGEAGPPSGADAPQDDDLAKLQALAS